jgi:hypothetical protein
MKSELRNLATPQQKHLDSTGHFAADLSMRSQPNRKVTLELLDVTDAGWRAIAHHSTSKRRCTVAVTRATDPGQCSMRAPALGHI